LAGDQFVTGQGNVVPNTSIAAARRTIAVAGIGVAEMPTLTLMGIGMITLPGYWRRRHTFV
jgi:hypothetical protein